MKRSNILIKYILFVLVCSVCMSSKGHEDPTSSTLRLTVVHSVTELKFLYSSLWKQLQIVTFGEVTEPLLHLKKVFWQSIAKICQINQVCNAIRQTSSSFFYSIKQLFLYRLHEITAST